MEDDYKHIIITTWYFFVACDICHRQSNHGVVPEFDFESNRQLNSMKERKKESIGMKKKKNSS